MKLVSEAMAKAQVGDIAREAIAVATTLALSWKPLRKSNTKAVAIKMISSKYTKRSLQPLHDHVKPNRMPKRSLAIITAGWLNTRYSQKIERSSTVFMLESRYN